MSKLDAELVRRSLADAAAARLEHLEVFTSIASTNTHLLAQAAPAVGWMRVALADHQTSGRGRHNRRWLSPPGSGLCLSLAYTFSRQPEQLPCLTLAIGVGIVDAMRELDIGGITLKWPNDIVALDGKLGGVLTEVQSRPGPEVTVVAGVGINIELPDALELGAEADWAQAPIDLHRVTEKVPQREVFAATMIGAVFSSMRAFEELGFVAFLEEWQLHDWLHGRTVTVDQQDGRIVGTAAGVDSDGALLVDTGDEQVRILSGTIAATEAPA